jgi:hypothetical protein
MIRKAPVRDQQGNILRVGDDIMYVTSDVNINYGTVIEFQHKDWYGTKYIAIRILKKFGKNLKKPVEVHLENPTMFKCGVVLDMPTDTVIEGT